MGKYSNLQGMMVCNFFFLSFSYELVVDNVQVKFQAKATKFLSKFWFDNIDQYKISQFLHLRVYVNYIYEIFFLIERLYLS